jgi:hypothetical protein
MPVNKDLDVTVDLLDGYEIVLTIRSETVLPPRLKDELVAEVERLRAELAATEVQRDTAWREADALRTDLETADAANESLLRRTRPATGTREDPG